MTITNPEVLACRKLVLEWVDKQETAVARADAAMSSITQLQELIVELAEMKAVAMRQMYETGWSLREIGEALGITGSRVEQIIKR